MKKKSAHGTGEKETKEKGGEAMAWLRVESVKRMERVLFLYDAHCVCSAHSL